MKHTDKQRRELLLNTENKSDSWLYEKFQEDTRINEFPYLAAKKKNLIILSFYKKPVACSLISFAALIVITVAIACILQLSYMFLSSPIFNEHVIAYTIECLFFVFVIALIAFFILFFLNNRFVAYIYNPRLETLPLFPLSYDEYNAQKRPSNGIMTKAAAETMRALCCGQDPTETTVEEMNALDRIWVDAMNRKSWLSKDDAPQLIEQARKYYGIDEIFKAYKEGVPIDDLLMNDVSKNRLDANGRWVSATKVANAKERAKRWLGVSGCREYN